MRKNYLISGAGSGIGKAIAVKLAAENNNCILIGRNPKKLEQTLNELKDGEHYAMNLDITSVSALHKGAEKLEGFRIDGLIANAGIGGENKWGIADRWNEIIETNLTGTYSFVNTFLPLLRQSDSSFKHVLIVSSVLARLGVANYSAYCASKAGLLGLMRAWAVEWAPEKILVNAVCPGWVNTSMAQEGMDGIAKGLGISREEFHTMAMKSVPLEKMSEPDEVADLIFYLLNQRSITGQTIDINNGSVMNS
jgi:NAD(P)-dependent dehydrogenase (short-subunit alcohol dehydrogenase family)